MDVDSGRVLYAQNPDACIACKMCERTCPDVCIEVTKE